MEQLPAAEWVKPADLVPWDANPRNNDGAAVRKVKASIVKFGFGAPIVARREGRRMIAGHTRLKAALELGLEEVPVRYMDVTLEQANMLAIADNRVGEEATWNRQLLSNAILQLDLPEVDLGVLGFDKAELRRLTGAKGPVPPVPQLPAEAVSRAGQLFELGPHRLVCGDSSDPDIYRLLLEGNVVDLVWTDPPYGVSVEGGSRGEPDRQGPTIANDDLVGADLRRFLSSCLGRALEHTKPGGVWYVAGPGGGGVLCDLLMVLGELGVLRHCLIWSKSSPVHSMRLDYPYQHETIAYGWRPGAAHRRAVKREGRSSVFPFPRPTANKDHPTEKPVELVQQQVDDSTVPGDLVLDVFGGSGTTLIACARIERVARLVELDPRYCDVIRRRWTTWADEEGVDAGAGALR